MDYKRIYYITTYAKMKMDFVFMDCGEEIGWRVYIINDINYNGKDAGCHATHRNHFQGDTYHCVCWSDRINTFEEAKSIASLWADATDLYTRFPDSFDFIAESILNGWKRR